MSLINPVQSTYPATRTGLDTVVENIQGQLATIPWITSPLLRAWNLPESRDGQLYRQPRIYSGGKEYWNSMHFPVFVHTQIGWFNCFSHLK